MIQVILEEGKMIAAGFTVDLHYYIKYAKGKINEELLRELSSIDMPSVPKNSTIISCKAMVHKDWQNKGLGERCAY